LKHGIAQMTLRRTLSAYFAFLTLMVMAVFAVVAGTGYIIYREREVAYTDAFERSALNARIFEENLTRSLETVQRFVEFVAAGPADSAAMSELFRRTLRQAPFLRSLSLLSIEGRILASSNLENIGTNIDLNDFFPPDSPSAGENLRLGRPWSGRDFSEGRPTTMAHPALPVDPGFVPLFCRAVSDGREVLVVGALNPDYFVNSFSQWLGSDDGCTEVLRYDRVRLFSSGEEPLTGEPLNDERFTVLWREAEIGHFRDDTSGERASFAAYRVSRHFPLAVVTRLYQDRALANWRQESGRLLAFAVPTLLALAYLATTLYRRDRLQSMEQEAERRRDYERLAATVFETVLEAVMVTDDSQHIIAVNPAFTRITGYSADEAIGADLSLLSPGYEQDDFDQMLQQTLLEQGHWEGEARSRRKSGDYFVAWMSINQIRDDYGKIVHQVTGFADITQYCAEAERISHLAHHDLLTGLANRALLLERMEQELRQAQRDRSLLGVLYFDLDKFKPVNDQLGHAVGDLLLQVLAKRIQEEVRAGDTLARLGGDEFVILLHGVRSSRAGIVVAEKIRRAVELPFLIGGHDIRVTSSIGIAFFPEHSENVEGLLQCADSAMYRAKALGGNRFEIYQDAAGQKRIGTVSKI